MQTYDIIEKKRNGGELTEKEIEALVGGYVQGDIPESQMAAWLMAVYFQGMTHLETSKLTLTMVASGQTLNLSNIPGVKVDKHSTGGVGDKTTLIVAPILAAAGVPIAKMSGRSLGHTGGTLDKLESIPGLSTELTPEEIVAQVQEIGIALAGQTAELVPADKKIYALRDQTATVDCIPLIAASIMSKKIASGADALILDVKVGAGAFMKSFEDAKALAETMVEIGKQAGKQVVAAITDMDQPLGFAVGNALEVNEAIRTMQGKGPDDLTELCTILSAMGLRLAGKASSPGEAVEIASKLLKNGQALAKFKELIKAQGGNPLLADDPSLLPRAAVTRMVAAKEKGFVINLDAMGIAHAALELGVGRGAADVTPDPSVGIVLKKKVGDSVSPGEVVAELHAKNKASTEKASELVTSAFEIGKKAPSPVSIIRRVIE